MTKNIIDVARGLQPADIVLKNGFIINMFTEEIMQSDVAIVKNKIVGIGKYQGDIEIDCTNQYITPGFIDAHMHVETTMVTPLEFGKSVIKKGTTTIIIDPHEIVNVSGDVGLDYMLQTSENAPIDVYVMMPSSVPASDIDTNGAGEFLANNMKPYLNHKRVIGLGEAMRFHDVMNHEKKMMDKIDLFSNQMIDGHAPGICGKDIQSYRAAGVLSDHECETAKEALEKLRAGLHILIREGSGAKNLESIIVGLLDANISFERCLFCTDDKHLDDIEMEGHINYCVKKAIQLGVPVIKAYKMATYSVAKAYHLTNLGALGAGYQADILIFDSLEEANPSMVIKNGNIMNDEKIDSYKNIVNIDKRLLHTVKCEAITKEQLTLKRKEKNIVMDLVPYSLLTKTLIETIPGSNTEFIANKEYNKLCAIERHGKTGRVSVCPLKGYGIENGAIATSVSHDAHNIIAVGDNDEDIIVAVNELRRLQGGYVIVSKGKILSSLQLNIAGLMSLEDKSIVSAKVKEMVTIANSLGVLKQVDPLITLSFLALTVIPEIRITEAGLFNVDRQVFID